MLILYCVILLEAAATNFFIEINLAFMLTMLKIAA